MARLGLSLSSSGTTWPARRFTLPALQEKQNITASKEVAKVIKEVTVELPLLKDRLLRRIFRVVDKKMVWEGKLEKKEQGMDMLVKIGKARNWLCAH